MTDMENIPGYKIQRELGRGGMACVYLAQEEGLERMVALKVMHKEINSNDEFIKRFLREARTASSLSHPHIVPIYAMRNYGGQCFIAMEYLPGGDLKDRIHDGLTVRDSLSIMQRIMSALSYAHGKGITHRDIKPDNIVFREQGEPVLTDFGIAKVQDSGTKLTATNMVMGTPSYMSPEQFETADVSSASDIYGIGVVLFEMLTGKCPFESDSMVTAMKKHLLGPIPKLPESLKEIQPLLDKMLAKQPDQRFRAEQVVDAIASLLSHLPDDVLAHTPEKINTDETVVMVSMSEETVTDPSLHAASTASLPAEKPKTPAPVISEQQIPATSDESASNLNASSVSGSKPQPQPQHDSLIISKKSIKLGSVVILLIAITTLLFLFLPKTEKADTTVATVTKAISTTDKINSQPVTRPEQTNADNPEPEKPDIAQSSIPDTTEHTPVPTVNSAENAPDLTPVSNMTIKEVLYPLTINSTPHNANIKLLNLNKSYKPGIQLPEGKYRIEIQATGYNTYRGEIDFTAGKNIFTINLEQTGSINFHDTLPSGDNAPEMVRIPSGIFVMGCKDYLCDSDNQPQHTVTINKAFALSKYEISVAEYRLFTQSSYRDSPQGNDKDPVTDISWNDAKAYTEWLSRQTGKKYRLPTEAEWEYAAKSGNDQLYPWSNFLEKGYANCNGCGSTWDNSSVAPRGQFKPNNYGLHDMAGNVWEWTEDCVNTNYVKAPNNGSAWTKGSCDARILRGGSWSSDIRMIKTIYRHWNRLDTRKKNYGLRIAREL